ncbi:MAG: hypothetical protein LC122_14890 [Chitinophagales bacterium]|nr:hypothetical protein [Chitinophagales bacterium]
MITRKYGDSFEDENGMIRVSGGSLFISFLDDMKKHLRRLIILKKRFMFGIILKRRKVFRKFLENIW